PFVATDLDGNGTIDVVLAQEARDVARSLSRDKLDTGFTPGAFRRDDNEGLIGPGDVALADVDGKNGKDLIFANTGSNNVLIYLRQADGTFAEQPLSFFAGTNPTGLHVADLNRDGIPDLAIANEGSNDISVLLGSRGHGDVNGDGKVNGKDLFRFGPRL